MTIRYAIPLAKYSHVSLRVYDLLGREVATLGDRWEEHGYKSVQWDAGGVPSGVYFYVLEAGDFVQAKKLAVVK